MESPLSSEGQTPSTPLDRLQPPKPNRRPVLLVMNGTFCPIHNNHLRTLEVARDWAENELGWSVVGGYVTVSHDNSCRRKLGSEHCPALHRLQMCRLATAESSWVMVDPYQASQPGNPGAQATLVRLEALVREVLQIPVVAVPVCGGDILHLLARHAERGVICVINRPLDFDLETLLSSPALGDHRDNVAIVPDTDVIPISSTLVRERARAGQDLSDLLPASVAEYHHQHQIDYQNVPEPSPASVPSKADKSSSSEVSWRDFSPSGSPLPELGRGVEAVVLAGTWKNQDVALKVWDLSGLKSRSRRRKVQAYHRERTLLQSLDHENVIRCCTGAVEEDRAFLVLERATGALWPLRIAEGVLPVFPNQRWLAVLQDIARAMVHLSENGIVHRDLMVQNLLYSDDEGRVVAKLSDFGVAQRLEETKSVIRGSVRHYPPEAIQKVGHHYYVEKSDVFMFGYVIHDLAHAKAAWSRADTPQAVQQTLAGERPPAQVPIVPEVLELMRRCWSQNQSDRPTFREVLAQLESTLLTREA